MVVFFQGSAATSGKFNCVCRQIILSATVKDLLKSDSICESYAQMKKVKFFDSPCIF